jgi:hypothetical protein
MIYEQVKALKAEEFKRLCGVRAETFKEMVEVVREHSEQKKKPGRPSKLGSEDQVLLTLEYWREYRTYFHIGKSWGIEESTAFRIIRKIENVLIKSGKFSLPGKKKLQQSDYGLQVVVVDVTESQIERPKKNKNTTIVEKRNVILLNLS